MRRRNKPGGGYRDNSRTNLVVGILCVVLAVLLGGILWLDKTEEDQRSAELQRLNKKVFQERQEQKAALKQKEAEDSFYQKLSDGFDVNVLIVGDSIGAGAGAQSDGTEWFGQCRHIYRQLIREISLLPISLWEEMLPMRAMSVQWLK